MNRRSRRLHTAAALLALAGPSARAEQLTAVHGADQPNLGRLVIDASGSANYRLIRDGDHVSLRFSRPVTLGEAPAPPRNVESVSTDGPTLDLRVVAGARVHPYRLNGRVVVDILPPVPAVPSMAVRDRQAKPNLTAFMKSPELGGRATPLAKVPAGPAQPVATALNGAPVVQPPVAQPAQPPAPSLLAQPTQAPSAQLAQPVADQLEPIPAPLLPTAQPIPPGRDIAPEAPDSPVSLLARRLRLPAGIEGVAFLAPFAATTGAAMFRDGDGVSAVFDERRPIDMSGLRDDPLLGSASVRMLANGTLIHVPLPPGKAASLTTSPHGWRIALLAATPRTQPIGMSLSKGALNLTLEEPGEVITMIDPHTGGTLLIGTQRRAGTGIVAARRTAELELRPTQQGVVLHAVSDRLVMRRTATGFQITGGPEGLYMSSDDSMSPALVDAASMSRRFALPAMKPEALTRLLVRQFGQAAAAPALTRGAFNHRAAETMVALGMGPEAQSLLGVAAVQDPREAGSADNAALAAIAALLAGRVNEAEALTDRRLDGSDEITMWRAIRQAMLDEGSPGAAALLTTTAPLALTYSENLRNDILPLILETMVQGGELASAKRLLNERKDDPKLAYARALLHQMEGDFDGAIAILEGLAQSRDAFDSMRAATRLVELRLAKRELTPDQAADALDKRLYAWRGDQRELTQRERVAELRAQTGRWTDALGLLRQAQTDFPEQAASVHERLLTTFTAMVHDTDSQHLRPLEFVTLVDENADLLDDPALEEGVDRKLAEDLLALDLPQRAKTVLEKLVSRSTTDIAKGRYGLTLASLQARQGDAAGALATLDGYAGGPLPDDLTEERLLLRASSKAQLGETAAALDLLSPVRTPRSLAERGRLLEDAGDWPAAQQAWSECVASIVPPDGALTEAQARAVLRLATATARAKDDAGLAALRTKFGDRFGTGPLADMFRLLTAPPVQTTADIARSATEASLAAKLPNSLAALTANPVAR